MLKEVIDRVDPLAELIDHHPGSTGSPVGRTVPTRATTCPGTWRCQVVSS